MIVAAFRPATEPGSRPSRSLPTTMCQTTASSPARSIAGRAELSDPRLADWIREEVAFPGSMIDRFVVRPNGDRIARFRDEFGYQDAWPVFCEDYAHWVIEDHFPSGRPTFEAAGATVVDDVAPFQVMNVPHPGRWTGGRCICSCLDGYPVRPRGNGGPTDCRLPGKGRDGRDHTHLSPMSLAPISRRTLRWRRAVSRTRGSTSPFARSPTAVRRGSKISSFPRSSSVLREAFLWKAFPSCPRSAAATAMSTATTGDAMERTSNFGLISAAKAARSEPGRLAWTSRRLRIGFRRAGVPRAIYRASGCDLAGRDRSSACPLPLRARHDLLALEPSSATARKPCR